MRRTWYWLMAFAIWMTAGLIYLNVGADLRETAPESGIIELQEGHFEDGFYITVEL